ncbi:NAD(P)H-hydrate dehydratase, partial [Patescibacteria group bacterium]|nr:NAD(P)H-hydrate dehydratase [Patescibacteria group bacterium]
CAAAYRVGAGLVTLATEPQVKIIVSKKLPEVTFLSTQEVFGKIEEYDVLLIGPGLGQSNQSAKLVRLLLEKNLPKIIIDADGLNILSKIGEWWKRLDGGVILTPHPGEMARLTGLSVDKIKQEKIHVAQYWAKKWEKIVVLKGANTVIASPTGEALISPFANPVLATAGTGDVLAGVIAGLLAQGLNPFTAASVGVFIHGQAGEQIAKKIGKAGMLASDLLPFLPQAIQDLVNKT